MRTLSDRFKDRGISAWNGKDQERALGDLLRIAKRGDYSLVEDVDRLSRQDRLTALNFVAGITTSPLFQRPVVNGVGFEGERQALVAGLEVRK